MPKTDVIVLDATDVPSPEDTAMLQALYSRSPKSVREHLAKVREVGSGNFMQQFYVNYGHKSIGDCGTTTIFIENVSLLAAKAIQDWPLYNGQEASTRYLDMTKQGYVVPFSDVESEELMDFCMEFYTQLIADLVSELVLQFPRKEDEAENVYMRAIRARAFDIARGFLPAGVKTNLSWHTNLRQASDHLKTLRHHPLDEVRDLADMILVQLQEKYQASFLHKKYEAEEEYLALCSEETYQDWETNNIFQDELRVENRLDDFFLRYMRELLESRPAKAELPTQVRMCGELYFEFLLDFGSYRDLQRHRACVQLMPLHTTDGGFHPWYLMQLPPSLMTRAEGFLREFERRLRLLKFNTGMQAEQVQYFVPLGYQMMVSMKGHLPAAVYMAELRSSPHVHPTLRQRAQQIGEWLKNNVPFLAMHHDMSPDAWNIQRGHQTIEEKK